MARGKEVLPAISLNHFRYQSPAEMPWELIESTAKKQFSLEERSEIHYCVDAFDREFHHFAKAPPLREVDHLRDALLRNCDAILELARLHQPMLQGKRTDVASALQIHFGTADFSFCEAFDSVAREAAKIVEGLKERPNLEIHTTAKTAETAGLTGFLHRVLDEAEPIRARSASAGGFVKEGLEYRRWGISIGPRANFTSAVLSRNVTKGMLRKAWPPGF
jgi:hypothetical protein